MHTFTYTTGSPGPLFLVSVCASALSSSGRQPPPGESYVSARRLLGVCSRTGESVRLVQLPAAPLSLTMSLSPPQRFDEGKVQV